MLRSLATWIALGVFAVSVPAEPVRVVVGAQASPVEQKAAGLLVERLAEMHVTAEQSQEMPDAGLAIVLGTPAHHRVLTSQMKQAHVPLPTALDPGLEGYVLKMHRNDALRTLVAAGVDERGVLYAVGAILRAVQQTGNGMDVPEMLEARTAPAFKIRGLLAWQGATIRELTHGRKWTQAEWERNVLNYVLAGANTFETGGSELPQKDVVAFFKSWGLDTLIHIPANAGSGPPEWAAVEAIGRPGYLCPSVPEARKALLDAAENYWKNTPDYDYVRYVSGDGGGCECDKCRPYGAVYIRLVHDLAAIARKYHPNIKVFASNQKLDNDGDKAIFTYLQQSDGPWLQGFCMGPGSNAMGWMPGRRQDHRMDLFDHPGFGPWSRYPQEVLHQLPPQVDLINFTDLTHWVYSEYGLMDHELIPDRNHDLPPHWGEWVYQQKPDPALVMVYDRRTFHARPRSYHRVFQEMMPFAVGDVTYSEGHHDHFNQWMWQRLLWDPHRTADDIVNEYAVTHFGARAAGDMAEAILQLEKNLMTPLDQNAGIDWFYALVHKAGTEMPPEQRESSYLWRQYMQKAALDKYIQLRLRAQQSRQKGAEEMLKAALESGSLPQALATAKADLAADIESEGMKELRDEAKLLGEESDRIYGVRSEGLFNLDQDFIGLGWLVQQVDRALALPAQEQAAAVRAAVNYEDPGPGGFYDDPGAPGRAPHLVSGYAFGETGFSNANRVSQRNMAFTTDEKEGVAFEYEGLDPNASYRVKLTLVRPSYLPRYASFQPQKTESIYAGEACLAKDLELPLEKAKFFEFDIPPSAVKNGTLRLWFQKSAGVGEGPAPQVTLWRNTGGWGTLCSEVWLMKK